MTTRGPIPELGESARHARARGCVVATSVRGDDTVVKIVDRYPAEYAWTIFWSCGIQDGVRRASDAP